MGIRKKSAYNETMNLKKITSKRVGNYLLKYHVGTV